MKIVRYQTTTGQTACGRLHADGRTTRLTGEIFGGLTDTGESAAVAKLLAPIEPRDIICIGLNYRKHAAGYR
jgi:2-keto-4-pentenoate hydratase/2-oxohepta-3-ene-1,7-dioic acid hydratase in catechol pathway